MSGPLEGYKIIDICRAGPGQMATGILADYGADVISIVEAGYAQKIGGSRDAGRPVQGALNRRNKRSLFIDLRTEKGREVLLKLIAGCDAVLESNRPGAVKRLGIDYESVKLANPSIIYCSLSGFGQNGPYATIAAHDLSFQGVGGLIPLDEQDKPFMPPYIEADLNAASSAAIALLMAFVERFKSGQGQYIDVSFTDVSLTLPPGRMSDEMLRGLYPCYNIFRTKDDRYLTLSIREPWFWERLCRLFGREEWIPHMRPKDELREQMFAFFRGKFLEKDLREWARILEEANLEFGPVNRTEEELKADPHLKARQMIIETIDPFTQKQRSEPGFALKFGRTPGGLRRGPQPMGSDTTSILLELGYSQSQIETLHQEGVTG